MSKPETPESGEDYEFSVPDFDEDEFIHKELTGFHSTAVLFVWGLGLGLLSWFLAMAIGRTDTVWFAGIALVAISIPLVARVMQKLKIDIDPTDRKGNFGRGFLLFFSWLAFAMLFLNPPIGAYVAPFVVCGVVAHIVRDAVDLDRHFLGDLEAGGLGSLFGHRGHS